MGMKVYCFSANVLESNCINRKNKVIERSRYYKQIRNQDKKHQRRNAL